MSVEGLTEPVACLGLHHPLFMFAVVFEFPRIIVARDIKAPLWRQLHFKTEIDGGGKIVQQIRLHHHVLGMKCNERCK